MTGEWARQDIFTGISDKVIISLLSKDEPCIQAALCTTVKLHLEWRFHFPSSWPQPLVFFLPRPPLSPSCPSPFGHTRTLLRVHKLDRLCDVFAVWCCFKVQIRPKPAGPPPSKRGPRGMSEPGRVSCPSQDVGGNRHNGQEDGKLHWGPQLPVVLACSTGIQICIQCSMSNFHCVQILLILHAKKC